jgi:hypothetical protein
VWYLINPQYAVESISPINRPRVLPRNIHRPDIQLPTPSSTKRRPNPQPSSCISPSPNPFVGSLVLRHPLWHILSLVPLLPSHHNCRRLLSSATLYLLQHIGPILYILPKMANMAPDLLVRLDAERDNGHEAKSKPFPALHDTTREVAAVLTLHGDVFGAFESGVEDCGCNVLNSWI